MNRRKLLRIKKKRVLNRRARERTNPKPETKATEEPVGDLTIKYFYINLDISVPRRKSFEEEIAKHNMVITRFPAVDGRKENMNGSWGCKQSHLRLWRQIKKDEIFVIFEDDIYILKNKFEEILAKLPVDWEYCNFGSPVTQLRPKIRGNRIDENFIRASKTTEKGRNNGCWAYAVKGSTIQKLLKLFPCNRCIDVQLRRNMDKFKAFFYVGPTVVKHGKVKNSIRTRLK